MTNIFNANIEDYIEIITKANFNEIAIELFHYQYKNNRIYNSYVNALGINANEISDIINIPFLPISFFKTHQVVTGNIDATAYTVFKSSTTTSDIPSKHYVKDASVYEKALLYGFTEVYGNPKDYALLALLPSYLEREGASLVYMFDKLMKVSQHPSNGFYLDDFEKLHKVLTDLEEKRQSTILVGVTFALLDFAEKYNIMLDNTIIIETGGMKGRKKEMIRDEVHTELKSSFHANSIHSEYGMTELLSQAYSTGDGLFKTNKLMKVFVRDINDPLRTSREGSGCINIIDLANIHSCSFIATEDIGLLNSDGSFNVMGRLDNSALRGCSLLSI